MKIFLTIVFALLLFANSASSWIEATDYVVASSCSTQSVATSQEALDLELGISNTTTRGQSFVSTTSGDMYGLKLYVTTLTSTSNLTIRVDDDLDMSSEYLGGGTVSVTSTGEIYIVFSSPIQISSGTTYYFFIQTAALTNVMKISWNDGSVYSGGLYYYNNSIATWALSTSTSYNDIWFKVMVCD